MFKATLKDSSILINTINAVKELETNLNIMLSPNGIDISTLDQSKISMCVVHLDKTDFFENIECTQELMVGVSLIHLSTVLKAIGTKKKVNILYTESADTISISSGSSNNYELKLMDIDSESIEVPNTTYTYSVKYKSSYFMDKIGTFSGIANNVTITDDMDDSDKENDPIRCLLFTFNGTDINGQERLIPISMGSGNGETDGSDDIKLIFSLNFLQKLSKCSFMSDICELGLTNDYPLLISWKSESKKSYINIHVAPRIDES